MAHEENGRGFIPLVVGVTGHRDLRPDDVAAVARRVDALLDEIAAQVPNTPLVLLSALAAGADTIAAEVAVGRGMALVACLPMPVDDYRADFSGDDERRFLGLLERCRIVRIVGTKPRDAAERVARYAAVGSYIAWGSNVLIALWDGADSAGSGGTADVVRLRLAGVPAIGAASLLEPPDSGSLFWIRTPHEANPALERPFEVERLYPEALGAEAGDPYADELAALARLDALNRDLAQAPAPATRPDRGAMPAVLAAIDAAANRFQRRSNVIRTALYLLAFVAASAQIALKDDLRSTIIKFGLLGIALAVFLYARKSNVDSRYEDDRALAEGLRVQDAWLSAGIPATADRYYLRMQAGELQWIRRALRTLAVLSPEPEAWSRSATVSAWIGEQRAYYERAAAREARSQRRLDVLGTGLTIVNLVAGATVAAMLFAPYPPLASFVVAHSAVMHGLLPLFIAWAALSAGLIGTYINERGFAESSRRYARMQLLYARAERQLRRRAKVEDLALELGRESLIEHAEWLLARRARPMSVIKN